MTKGDFETIGVASFTQLAELRHRGAFSTVSQTFATCCLRCGQSSDPEIAGLPHKWYQVRISDERVPMSRMLIRRYRKLERLSSRQHQSLRVVPLGFLHWPLEFFHLTQEGRSSKRSSKSFSRYLTSQYNRMTITRRWSYLKSML